MRSTRLGPLLRSYAIGPVLVSGLLLFAAVYRPAAVLHRAGFPRAARAVTLVFSPVSVLLNLTAGTIIWLDAPREFTFSARVARKSAEGDPCARQIHACLVAVDPSHFDT